MSVKTESLLAYLEANSADIAEALDADEEETDLQIGRLRRSVEAFETMREALLAYQQARDGGDYTAADEAADAALAQADEVTSG